MMLHARQLLCALIAAGVVLSSPATAQTTYEPRQGQWSHLLILKADDGKPRELVLSSASYPATCAAGLKPQADEIETSNGYVWTDADYRMVAYKPGEFAKHKREVLELSCRFVPWPTSPE